MKKLSILFTIISLAFSLNLSADGVKCNTIAEIKALADGTACEYVGNATTTYYYDNHGVMMQDATGAILLYNKYLGAAKAGTDAKIKTTINMEITDVWGTFKKEGGSLLDRIVLSDDDAEYILITNENATFTPEEVNFDTYVTKLEEYKGVAVLFNEINIRSVSAGSLNCEFYSATSNSTLSVPFNTRIGNLPVKASLAGFLGRDGNGNNIFMIGSKEAIKPLAFNSILDIKNIVTDYNEAFNYDLLDTFAVSHVVPTADGKIVYIQERDVYQPDHYDHALRIEVPAAADADGVKRGDYIVGVNGKYRPYTGDSIAQRGASFFQNAASSIKVVASGAECRALPKYIYTFTGDNMQNAYRYESTLVIFSGGKIQKESDGTYSYVIENENGTGLQSIGFHITGVEDLSAYEGRTCAVRGIVDVANTYPNRQFSIICRDEADILESNMQFETIADLIATGELGSGVTYEITKPVFVSYTFAKTQNIPTYYFIVQDHTAGIIVDLGTVPYELVQAGDSISGLRGVYNNTRGITTDFLAVDESARQNIVVKSRNNEIKGLEVTFAEILADKKLYENRVVTVRNVHLDSVFHPGTDYMPQDAIEGCFTQGTDTIYYTTGANAGNFTFYDNMDITGIVDNKVIGEYYSIWPLSQAHIINLDEESSIDNIQLNANIYSADNTLFIETAEGASIRVFSMAGQCLYVTSSANTSTVISDITENSVIVLVNDMAYKLMIK